MPRRSSTSVTIDPNVRCLRIYPTEKTKKTITELQSVGFKLSRDHAIHLARVLLAVTQQWDEIDITGYRFDSRTTDGSYRLTITSSQPDEKE
jgi:hypothetical protein